jgi:ABC-type branched-subunit amino acid transport system substrate-binding protein
VTYFPDAGTFADDYQAEFGEPVQPFGAQSYDSAGFCLAAIAKAAVDAGAKPTREQVVAAMHELPPLQGITGVYEFDEEGDPTEAAYYILSANTDPAAWGENELAAQIDSAPPEE